MDAIVVILLAAVLSIIYRSKDDETAPVVETVEENPMLNPEMKHDEHAFMKIANELGFH